MNTNSGRTEQIILVIVLAVFVLIHFYQINSPPNGYHQFRESDTAAVIFNYYQEDANFFHMRCNQRGAGTGITGGELPTYQYSSFILYFLFGPFHFLARLLTLFGSLVALWFFRKIITILSDERTANFSTMALAFAPLFLFYSYKIMPDIWMFMYLMGAIYFFLNYVQTHKIKHFVWSCVFMVLSATIKPLGLCLFFPFLVYLLKESPNRKKALLTMSVYCIVTMLPMIGWFLYGRHLNSIHNINAFTMGEEILKSPQFLMESQFYKKLFLQWPFELWIGWGMLPAFVYGVAKLRKSPLALFSVAWIIASYLVFAVVAEHANSHDYYTLVIVPPIAAISGWGVKELWSKPKLKVLLIVYMLLVLPISSIARIAHRFTKVEEFEQIRTTADIHIPKSSLVIVQETTRPVKLYQLNRHGWPFRDELKSEKIKPFIDAGGEYLILDKPIDSSLKKLVEDSLIQIGPLYAYRTLNLD